MKAENDARREPIHHSAVVLTPDFVTNWSRDNMNYLPHNMVYNTVAADADLNANARIDISPEITWLAEDDSQVRFLKNMAGESMAIMSVDYAYQKASSVWKVVTATLGARIAYEVNPFGFMPNDTAVTIRSAQGWGIEGMVPSYDENVRRLWGGNTRPFQGDIGKNHSSVQDSDVASQVLIWLAKREEDAGDLRW